MRLVVTAADDKFKSVIGFWQDRVEVCGLTPVVYDLGGLEVGRPLDLSLPGFGNFRQHGYYLTLADGTYKSRAVHKPSVVIHALREHREDVLYLDADAFLRGVPTKMEGDWDVCVTIRPTSEQTRTSDDKRSYLGLLNAGVIWFARTAAALHFVGEWHALTLQEMNDQRALNLLCQNVRVGQVTTVNVNGFDVRVMAVPTGVYNNYYNEGVNRAAVVHLKNAEWVGKTPEELCRRCKVTQHAPAKVKEGGFWSRLFPSKPKPTVVHHHHYDDTVYVYDDSGINVLDYYITYRVLDNLFSSPPPAPPPVEEFVPPEVPDYTAPPVTVPPIDVRPEDYLAVPSGVKAEITEFPAEFADTGPASVPDDAPADDPTPVSDNGS
jgi:hypothetical protein